MSDSIPSEIREKYEPLFQDVCHVHRKWGIFCQLYASGENVIQLLNSSAPGFFRIFKDVLAGDIILSIGRLTDPKQSFQKKENLSLEQLVHCIDAGKYPGLRHEIERLFAVSRDKCAFVREQRNRRIAHTDLSTKLQVQPLTSPTKTNVDAALDSIRAVMNVIEKYFNEPIYSHDVNIAFVDYSHFLTFNVDGTQLIAWLREAEAYRNQANSRIASRPLWKSTN